MRLNYIKNLNRSVVPIEHLREEQDKDKWLVTPKKMPRGCNRVYVEEDIFRMIGCRPDHTQIKYWKQIGEELCLIPSHQFAEVKARWYSQRGACLFAIGVTLGAFIYKEAGLHADLHVENTRELDEINVFKSLAEMAKTAKLW